MALIQKLIKQDRYPIKSPYTMEAEGICIHNTANDATAQNEVAYMERNDNKVSFHIAVDDNEAIQCIPFNRTAYAAGDGSGAGNRKHIHIEICYSKSGGSKFLAAEKRAAKETAALLKQFKWDISRIKTHKDFSGKHCPHRTLDMGWKRFIDMVSAELNEEPAIKPSSVKYRVVINSYKERANAEKTQADLKAKGYDSFLEIYKKDGEVFFRVIAGSFDNRTYADNQLAKIEADGFKGFISIYDPSRDIAIGNKVKINPNATRYATGELIPSFVKSKQFTVENIKNDMALMSEIISWLYKKDLILV